MPLRIMLAIRLVPAPLLVEFRAEAMRSERPISRAGLAFILAIWLACLIFTLWGLSKYL